MKQLFNKLRDRGFQIDTLHHAEAILRHDLAQAASELEDALSSVDIPVEELVKGGGGEGQMTQRLRRDLSDRLSWKKHVFEIRKVIDGEEAESISHEVDHVKRFANGTFALEIEWNNKDPFFDRDLENFKRLHADGVISIGAIVTRGESLHEGMRGLIEEFAKAEGIESRADLPDYLRPTTRQVGLIDRAAARHGSFSKGWAQVFVSDKFGEATTHWRKLMDRVKRGVGNPCPLVLIGIPKSVVITER
ncbi:MAG: BglII/BstYI family type II restriction endonuclease [Planctomycetota bacterium]